MTTIYVSDVSGQMVLEDNSSYDATISGTRSFTADHLGSTRRVMDSSGQAKRYDYLPFGGSRGIPISVPRRIARFL